MVRFLIGLHILVALVMLAFVMALSALAFMMVMFYSARYGFTPLGVRGLLAAVCLMCAAWFLVLPAESSYRERIGFFLTCLTLYSIGKGVNPVVVEEWLVLATTGLSILLGKLLQERAERLYGLDFRLRRLGHRKPSLKPHGKRR